MKRRKILAAIMSWLCLLSCRGGFPGAAEEYAWSVDSGDRVNVLRGNPGRLQSASAAYDAGVMTDGKHYGYGTDPYVFLNERCYANEKAAIAAEAHPGTFSFPLSDGKIASYYYTVSWQNIYADVDGFSLCFSGEKAYSDPESHFPNYQVDAAFDILVSADGGCTWEIAFSSERLAVDPESSAIITAMAGFTEEEGIGNAVEVKVPDPEDPSRNLTAYRVISGTFPEPYRNITDIVYGCVSLRRSGKIVEVRDGEILVESHCVPMETAWHFPARISEFEVYGKLNEKPVLTESTTAEEAESSQPEPQDSTTDAPDVTLPPVTVEATVAATKENTGERGCRGQVSGGAFAVCLWLGNLCLRRNQKRRKKFEKL